jgi:hypothetical protein
MYVYATGGPSRTHSAKWRICILQTVSRFGLWPFRQGATGYLPRRLNLLLRDQLRRDQFHFEASRFVACLPVIKPIEADSALISFVNVLNWGWRQDRKVTQNHQNVCGRKKQTSRFLAQPTNLLVESQDWKLNVSSRVIHAISSAWVCVKL